MSTAIDHLAEKLAQLPPERIAEVVDFVDFIAEREHERTLVRAAQTASETSLARLWNNDVDAAYDQL
ncbi:toxin-antitoxin system, antitoxin component, Xre family protein [Pseudomarimonas arenosa]|uniref:Toxin-antitoxin system, antitoxin component, Xre family protein n=1 Tax=Pseudomarimonas arenosa TaxID=2774145 RepID=A0AAW3ZRW5_9GAMM|nr:toxin-antitoxin system, antitoxin component, Xre family protein [Pseudomarimonas arenosa]MBD8528199.1 toxin-antitoxin system, antitoxin component, Xre family protein [Pseudomarimonas arenosa]